MPPIIYSLIDSPAHPDLRGFYKQLGLDEYQFTAMRKAMNSLKRIKPDYVVGEFIYGYGNNYAGANVCNLDVFLASLQKYAPAAKVIVLVQKQERKYVDRLSALFPLYAVLDLPLDRSELKAALS